MTIRLSQRISQTAPYAFARIDEEVRKLKAQGVSVIDFGVGDPTSPTPDFVVSALQQAAQQRVNSGYPSYVGEMGFRQACADYLKRDFGVTLDPATEITSTIGSKEAVFNFPLGFVDPGDIVICPTPGYPPYKNGTRFAGAIPYFAPLTAANDFLLDFRAIPADVVARTKIIWINYPNSPTGKMAPRQYLEDLVAWAQEHNIIVAADEGCYIDIYFDHKPVSILEIGKKNVVAFYSLSKRNNMTGYRVGFVAGDAEIVAAFRKVKTNIDSGTPTIIQDAAMAALADDEHVALMREEYRRKREILLTILTRAGFPPVASEATFYLWQRAPDGMTGVDLAERLLKLGIVVTPGEWISDEVADGSNPGREYVRFALVAREEEVEEAGRRISCTSFFKGG